MAPSWRVAKCITVLLNEINYTWPNRDKASDGTIGDPSHQSRNSDHNPWVKDNRGIGVVTAVDIDDDIGTGFSSKQLAEHFRVLGKQGDPRVKYVISYGRICSNRDNWAWRKYTGVNLHRLHVHLSVSSSRSHYDNTSSWQIHTLLNTSMENDMSANIITKASPKYHIRKFQRVVKHHPKGTKDLKIDGIWGPTTDRAWKQLAEDTFTTVFTPGAIREVDYIELRLDGIESRLTKLGV